jgi:ABC-2 type transport system ATP-binding protein
VQVRLAAGGGGPSARPLAPLRALVVEGLYVRYGAIRAVDGLSFDVPAGTVVGLIGPNGCGKTSALRAVTGLVRPTGGRVLVNGVRQGTTAARARVAYVPDEPDGLEELCLDEYLRLVSALYRAGEAFDIRAGWLLRAFGLERSRRVRLGSLSHGQRRIASIVAALALARPLLVVDEATAALDPEASAVLRESLRTVAELGSGVLVATQELAFAERACDLVVLLSNGRAIASGPTKDVAGGRSLEEAYLDAVGARARLSEVRRGLGAV